NSAAASTHSGLSTVAASAKSAAPSGLRNTRNCAPLACHVSRTPAAVATGVTVVGRSGGAIIGTTAKFDHAPAFPLPPTTRAAMTTPELPIHADAGIS